MVALKSGLIVPTRFGRASQAHDGGGLVLPAAELPDETLLVVGKPPNDLDAFFVAPDPDTLGAGPNPSLGAISAILNKVPVEPAMFGLAGIAAAAWHAGMDQAKHLKLAEEIFV